MKQKLTKEQADLLIKLIDEYKEQLYNTKTVSATRFSHMQTALFGVKLIVKDLAGIPRKSETAWVK
jgi:hypothetical protein